MHDNISSTLINRVRDKVFSFIHQNNLIYNTSWEDPRIDRQLLHLDEQSRVIMITSAGCNVLDYALDNPQQIYTMDANPRQNALLQLKIEGLKKLDYNDFFDLFGYGRHAQAREIYYEMLRPGLPDYAQNFWDDKHYYFLPNTENKTFYFRGTSGNLAWLAHKYLQSNEELWRNIQLLLHAQTIEEQQELFDEIEPNLWNALSRYIVQRSITMSLLGVPRPQMDLIEHEYDDGLYGYIRESLRQVFTQVPVSDNYFWRVYLTGTYSKTCCPEYLKQENFDFLKKKVEDISVYNLTVNEFLRQYQGKYTHYILLDHQDWLAWHEPESLLKEWQLILKNSSARTRIIMRSAGNTINYIPDDVNRHLKFHPDLTDEIHKNDRVGTYESLHFAEVI